MKRGIGISIGVALVLAGVSACGGGDEGTPPDDVVGDEAVADVTGDEGVAGDEAVAADEAVTGDEAVGDTCKPDCYLKDCGDDGCGGSCGSCGADQKCQDAKCVACALPTAWGPTAVLKTLAIPDVDATIEAKCPDLTGDGKGDNGLKALAGVVNPQLGYSVPSETFEFLFEFLGLTDFANTPKFTLNALSGVPDPDGQGYLVDPATYDASRCFAPVLYSDPEAALAGGKIASDAESLAMAFPIQGVLLKLKLTKAAVTGTISNAGGVSITDGFIGGVLKKTDLDAAIADFEDQCKAVPAPEYCKYLQIFRDVVPLVQLDLDLDEDGTKDAVSMCVQYTMTPATIDGYKQPEPCKLPTTWGAIGRVDTTVVPKEATEFETLCPDFSGDAKGDNGLAPFADAVNPLFQQELDKGFYGAVGEFVGVTDWTNTAAFTLNVIPAGAEVTGSSNVYLNPLFYDAQCLPLVSFPDAKITAGVLAAGPQNVSIGGKWLDTDIEVAIQAAQIRNGTLASTADGVTMTGAVLAGVITKATIDKLVAALKARCGQPDPPEECANVGLLDLVPGALDLDRDKNGEKDAASLCVKFSLAPAKVVGYGIE
jgi:hypothetical protein